MHRPSDISFLGIIKEPRLLLIAAAAVCAVALAGTSHADTGHTAGSFSVDGTGNANYVIPIWVPPGPNHLQPNIALTYNSSQGNGYVGVGWSVSGLSSIYRCNRTVAQDGATQNGAAYGVTLVTSDALCLDGQRLQLTGGVQGTGGSTYQTEIANFENVTAYGSAGNGPGYFIVQAPNGTQYEYGNPLTTASAQVLATGTPTAAEWMLDKVTDPAGNTMLITYITATGTAVPNTISWTPISSGSGTYQYAMQFTYGTNVPQSSVYGYVAGTPVTNTQLLQSVAITYSPNGAGASTIKQYNLGYTGSPVTGREELTSVTECTNSPTSNCLSPTTFTYQNTAFGISTTATTAVTLAPYSPRPILNYDFNGDGIPDILYTNGTTWYVALGTPTGYGAGINTGIAASNVISQSMVVGDVLGTHHDGILVQNGSDWYYYTYYYTLNGGTFSGESTGLAVDTTAANFALVDVNGDGLPDFVSGYVYVSSSNPAHLTTRLNNSSGGSVSFGSVVTAFTDTSGFTTPVMYSPDSFTGGLRSWDFNGDGRQDLFFYGLNVVCSPTCTTTIVADELLGQSNGTFTAAPLPFTYTVSYTANTLQFLNWNNDKCTDITWATQVFVSACNGTIGSTLYLSGTLVTAMDVDGDGRKDAIINDGGTLAVQISTGVGVNPAITLGIPYDSSAYYGRLDVGGVGLDELEVASITQGNVNFFARNSPDTIPDVLTSAADGFGNSATPTYFSITQGANNHYSVTSTTPPESTDAAFTSPLYIVGTVTLSDPSATGASYTQNHYYTNAWQNLQGRGFLGFTTHQIIDSRNSVAETLTYNMVFPTTGLVVGDFAAQNSGSGATISNLTATPAATTLDSAAGAQRYFPYISNLTQNRYEVGGTKNGQLITTTAKSYTYDSYGNATNITSTVTDNDSGSPQSPLYNQYWTTSTTNTPQVDTTHWCLNLLSETQTEYTVNGTNSLTRTRTQQLTPDTALCRYTQIVTEPNSSYEVTTQLGYDAFGNVNSDAVTGLDLPTRTTGITWNPTGQFPQLITNALNQTMQLAFDPVWGKRTSVTDPNGVQNQWSYDPAFGRLSEITRPDRTSTQFSYSDCASAGGCLIGSHGVVRAHTTFNSDGSTMTDGTDYYDSVDRSLVRTQRMLASGTYSRNEVRYDNLGNVSWQAAPCQWSVITSACASGTTLTHDWLNRLTQSQLTGFAPTTYTYSGRTLVTTDPNGHAKTTITDVNGWLREALDANGYAVTLNYDAAGGKIGTTDNQGRQLWSGTVVYGIAPFLVNETDSALGTRTYQIDPLGELTGMTDANGNTLQVSYDALSRMKTRTEIDSANPDLNFFTQWNWDSAPNGIGKLQSVCTLVGGTPTSCTTSSPGYSESEGYDNLGRLQQRSITIPNSVTFAYGYGYNTSGQLGTLTYPATGIGSPLQIQYAYTNGILQSVQDVADSINVWTANAANPAGQVTQETLGNGVVINRSFDPVARWLSSVTAGVGGGATLENQTYGHDAAGNVTIRQENNLGLNETFHYDNLNRLYYSQLAVQQSQATTNLTMCYDNSGGSCTENVPGPGSITAETSDAIAPVSYIATWTPYNYPAKITAGAESVEFSYGPGRQRWQQNYNSGAEITNYIGGLLEQVVTSSGTNYRQYVYAGSEPVAIISPSSSGNTLTYMLSDHQGSPSALLNSSGSIDVSESFTAYGARRDPSTWSGAPSSGDLTTIAGLTRQGYTFQTALGQFMGMNHMNGRVQDAITGQFLSPDPNIPDPTNTQDYNRYSYVRNNPLTLTDPTGFDPPLQEVIVTASPSPGFGIPFPNITGATGQGDGAAAAYITPADETYFGQVEQEVLVYAHKPKAPPQQILPQTTPLTLLLTNGCGGTTVVLCNQPLSIIPQPFEIPPGTLINLPNLPDPETLALMAILAGEAAVSEEGPVPAELPTLPAQTTELPINPPPPIEVSPALPGEIPIKVPEGVIIF